MSLRLLSLNIKHSTSTQNLKLKPFCFSFKKTSHIFALNLSFQLHLHGNVISKKLFCDITPCSACVRRTLHEDTHHLQCSQVLSFMGGGFWIVYCSFCVLHHATLLTLLHAVRDVIIKKKSWFDLLTYLGSVLLFNTQTLYLWTCTHFYG